MEKSSFSMMKLSLDSLMIEVKKLLLGKETYEKIVSRHRPWGSNWVSCVGGWKSY